MKGKLLLTLLFIYSVSNAQYSKYYTIDQNVNANINKNVNVSGNVNVNKNISTIDYGKLALANAENEKTRLANIKYEEEKQSRMSLEIASNPKKAYDYSNWLTISSQYKKKWDRKALKKIKKNIGFKTFTIQYLVPNKLLFSMLNVYRLQNVSSDGITTDILIYFPMYNKENKEFNIEKQYDEIKVGEEIEEPDDQNKIRKIIFHKKDLNRATVFGSKGYLNTVSWEDKFEYGITDNYRFQNENLGNGYSLFIKVRYYGDKDIIDFEKLEGRKFYLKPLIDKMVSTAKVRDLKY